MISYAVVDGHGHEIHILNEFPVIKPMCMFLTLIFVWLVDTLQLKGPLGCVRLLNWTSKGTVMWGFDVLALCEVGSTHKTCNGEHCMKSLCAKIVRLVFCYCDVSHICCRFVELYSVYEICTKTKLLINWLNEMKGLFLKGEFAFRIPFISNETVKGNWDYCLFDVKNFNAAYHFDPQVQPIV